MDNKGYGLVETLLAVTVTMIVLTVALRLLAFTSEASARTIVRGELLECARTAANIMNVNIQRASEIKIQVNENKTLIRMELVQPGRPESYVFSYNRSTQAGYHRLTFSGDKGSNELASNLADIRILPDSADTIIIEILTDNTITVNNDVAVKYTNITAEPVFLRFPVNITGKKRF